jgi:hypothetical protein
VSLSFSLERIDSVNSSLSKLEVDLSDLISLDQNERNGLIHFGPKSEAFVRGILRLLEKNPRIVPQSLELSEAIADVVARDVLLSIQEDLRKLLSRVDDTIQALGHDAMVAALDGYALLKVTGDANGLEDLRKELGARFAKTRRKTPPVED